MLKLNLMGAAVAALLMASAFPASATIFGGDDITNNYHTTNNQGGKGGEGGQGGTGIGISGAAAGAAAGASAKVDQDIRNTANGGNVLGSGNSANDIDNRIDTRDTNTNLGLNAQGQKQQQSTSSSATGGSVGDTTSISGAVSEGSTSASSSDNAVTINDNDSVYYERAKRTVQSAVAPPVINVAPCTVGMSGAAQGATFGISLGGGRQDEQCQQNARAGLIAGFSVADAEDYLASYDETYRNILAARREREANRVASLAQAMKAEDQAKLNTNTTVAVSTQPFTTSQAKGTMAPIPN